MDNLDLLTETIGVIEGGHRTQNQKVCCLGAKYTPDGVMILNTLSKADLISMLVEHYILAGTLEETTNIDDLLTILRNKLTNTSTKLMINNVMTVVFIVGKAIEDIEHTRLIKTDVQDLMVQYSDSEDLIHNTLESSVKPKFATLCEFYHLLQRGDGKVLR